MYFEDFELGDTFTTDELTLAEADIIAFAAAHDPQPFHVDPEAAGRSIYGGLIASGWQVLSWTFGLAVEFGLFRGGGQGSPGLDEVRWLRPVRPGDTLHVVVTVTALRRSSSRADRGYVTLLFEVNNQRGEVVASYRALEIFLRRPGGA